MERNYRTINMTPERQTKYENARERAQKIIEVCNEILDAKKTEAKACNDIGINCISFRNFCSKISSSNEEPEATIKKEDWDHDWRENLLFALTEEYTAVPDDFDAVFEDICKHSLIERYAIALKMRMEGFTLEEVGKKFGITRERVRQMEAKSIRILRHPARRMRLVYGDKYCEILKEYEDAQSKYDKAYLNIEYAKKISAEKEMDKMIEETKILNEKTKEIEATVGNVPSTEREMIDTKLEDLGLSVRSFNCLHHHFWLAKVANPTAYDVSKLSVEELSHIRNLGTRSLIEIEECFKSRFSFTFVLKK